MNKDKLQKEIDELRKQKSELQQKMSAVQQQIDNKILEFEDIPNFKGLYIHYRDTEFNCDVYMLVKNSTKTCDGLRLNGYAATIFDDESVDVVKNQYCTIAYNKISEIKEITKEFFKETIYNKIISIIDII